MFAFWNLAIISSRTSQSPFCAATRTMKMFAPTEKLAAWLATTSPVMSFSTMSQLLNIMSMMSMSMEFILVWNSRQATPSPMSTSVAPPFWAIIFWRSLSERKEDYFGVVLNPDITFLVEIVVVISVRSFLVKRFGTRGQHVLDLLRDGLAHLFHHGHGFLQAHGIPGLERPEFVVVSPADGVIHAHDRVADLRHPVGGINEVVGEVFPDDLSRPRLSRRMPP